MLSGTQQKTSAQNNSNHENSEGLASSHESEFDSNTTLCRYGWAMNIVKILKCDNDLRVIE